MKKFLLAAGVALLSVGTNAQVGINAGKLSEGDPHELAGDAVLHVENKEGQHKGVLLPSVSLTSATDQNTTSGGSVTKGLMVWNDGRSGLAEGYYYWDGVQWNKMEGKTYQGTDGINVHGDEIGLSAGVLGALKRTNALIGKTLAERGLQMVPLHKVNLKNRTVVTGVDGTYKKDQSGRWLYTGKCVPTKLEYVSNDFSGRTVRLRTDLIPSTLLAQRAPTLVVPGTRDEQDVNLGLNPEQVVRVSGTLYQVQWDHKGNRIGPLPVGIGTRIPVEDIIAVLKNTYGDFFVGPNPEPYVSYYVTVTCAPTDLWLYEE